ncbi:MAG: hypothetical protein AAF682_18000 [Planctomycetota bacterium]
MRPTAFVGQALVGLVRIDTIEKQLEIAWSFDGAGGERLHENERFDLDFWPTAASRVSDKRLVDGQSLLVAGKRPSNGRTVIERWDLALAALPGPATTTPVQRTVLYDQPAGELGFVRMLNPVNGLRDAAFLQFDGARELRRVDASSGNISVLVTTEQAPSLALESYVGWWGGVNQDGEYVYQYHCNFAHDDDGALVLVDQDGDGVLDEWTEYAGSQLTAIEAVGGTIAEFYGF